MKRTLRLGVNIDHVATIRNARDGRHPDPVRAARLAVGAGADGITAHLREDRRHISDHDITRLSEEIEVPLNLEMAATREMLDIALRHRPHAACIVPEKRQERTTEGGLDVVAGRAHLAPFVDALRAAGIRVSFFVEPDLVQLDAAVELGAPVVELHPGAYCEADGRAHEGELARIVEAAAHAATVGLGCHASRGQPSDSVLAKEANPPNRRPSPRDFLIGEAIFGGLESSIKRMRALMDRTRAEAVGAHSP